MKRILASILAAAFAISMVACGSGNTTSSSSTAPSSSAPSANASTPAQAGGEIYYLNFKPEIAEVYNEIAKVYEQETGVKVTVVTAASGTYEQTLKSEMGKGNPPTIFQINGPRGYASWKDYCADLSNTELYAHLTDKSLAIADANGVYGIPYVVEGYGIIYNDAIMQKYFALDGAKAKNMDEINNFAKLKEVVEDMQSKKDQLGIKGVFASTSLKPGEDWRWQTHLANVPIFYEFKNNNVDLTSDATKEIKFQYANEFKNIFDLYINNSTVEPKLLGTKQVADSMAEFALGQAAMVQNGNWAWSQVAGVEGNTVKEEDIKFMPIYTGIAGEENQGLATGTENFICINKQAPAEQQKLAADFLYWLYSSEKGKDFVTNKLGFIAPFDTFTDAEKPKDPLAKEVLRWMEKPNTTSVAWNFTVFPSQTFKDNFGAGLLQYAQGQKKWEEVTNSVVADWKAESNA